MQPIIIKLKIFSNPTRFDGFNQLISKGNISIGNKEADRNFPISDSPAICLFHRDDHVYYFLRESGASILPLDSESDGRLSIILAIPKNHSIKGGVSPYEVLMDVYNSFISKYMTVINDSNIKRFKSTLESIVAEGDEFRKILDKYELEPVSTEYVPMNPEGIPATLHLPQDKLNEFFCDTQYPEFRTYKEIYITTQGKSSEELAGIKIPREKEYEIWENDRFQKKSPLFATTPIHSNGGLNSEDITHDPVSVTLQELIEAEGNKLTFGQSTAELNLKTRRITLTIPPIKVYYKLEFVFKGDEEGIKKLKQNLETGVNSLLIDGTDVSKEISNPDSRIAPSKTNGRIQFTGILQGCNISAKIDRNIVDKKAVLTLSITKKSEEPATRKTSSNQSGTTKNSNQKSLVTTTDPTHTQPREDYEEHLTPKPNKKWLRFAIRFSIGLLIGSLIGFGLGYALHASEDKSNEELTQLEEKYKQLDANYEALKTKYRELEDKNEELKDKNKELEKQRQQQTIEVKPNEQEKTVNVDPLTLIQNRHDFQEFMNMVKSGETWSKIEKHQVFKALQSNAKIYSWKVQYFIKPEGLFNKKNSAPMKTPNHAQSTKIREWKRPRPQVNNLEDIKKEVDKLVEELKKLK